MNQKVVIVLSVIAGLLIGAAVTAYTWLTAQVGYAMTQPGSLKGKLTVEWIAADQFIFIADPENPLTFTRSDGVVIQPKRMFTDGGSVPPALRALKSYSPWGFAPAFIIHDWIFTMKHCKIAGYEAYDLNRAATVMSEVMKTLMQDPKYGGANPLVHYSFHEAVTSPTARKYWDAGTCLTDDGPKSDVGPASERSNQKMDQPKSAPSPIATYTLEF